MRRLAGVLSLAGALTMVACGGSSSSGSAPSEKVSLSEYKVSVSTATMAAGRYRLEIANAGSLQHEFLVFRSDLAPSAYPVTNTGDIVEDGQGITKLSDGDDIDPGHSQTRRVDLTAPGTYLFVCNLPGHFKLGMYAVVTVQ